MKREDLPSTWQVMKAMFFLGPVAMAAGMLTGALLMLVAVLAGWLP